AGPGTPAPHCCAPRRRARRAAESLLYRGRKWLPLAERRLREELFDLAVSRSAELRESGTVLFMKPVFPRSAAQARGRGSAVFALATIQHPAFNAARVALEQRRWGIGRPTTYTDRER